MNVSFTLDPHGGDILVIVTYYDSDVDEERVEIFESFEKVIDFLEFLNDKCRVKINFTDEDLIILGQYDI